MYAWDSSFELLFSPFFSFRQRYASADSFYIERETLNKMKAKTKRSLGHGEERSAVRRTSLSIGIFHRQTSLVYALSNNHRLEVSGIALTLKRADHLSPIASPFMGSDPSGLIGSYESDWGFPVAL